MAETTTAPAAPEVKKNIVSKAAMVKIMKNAGAKRIGKDTGTYVATLAEEFVTNLAKKASLAAEHANRKVVRPEDVELVIDISEGYF